MSIRYHPLGPWQYRINSLNYLFNYKLNKNNNFKKIFKLINKIKTFYKIRVK
jgi:hypothetical protein